MQLHCESKTNHPFSFEHNFAAVKELLESDSRPICQTEINCDQP